MITLIKKFCKTLNTKYLEEMEPRIVDIFVRESRRIVNKEVKGNIMIARKVIETQVTPLDGEVWTITFGEATESHVGMNINGKMADKGYDLEKLKNIMIKFQNLGCSCDLMCLNDISSSELDDYKDIDGYDEKAYVLVIRSGLKTIVNYKKLCEELASTKDIVNKKAFMRGQVKNKNARWGFCVGDLSQEPDYENKKGRIIDFKEYTYLQSLREKIRDITDNYLLAEVNYYYDPKKCYIGYHGDRERRIVIGCRLGESWYIRFRGFYQSKRITSKIDIKLNPGDMYIMGEKSVGQDWLKRNKITWRHAAGNKGYIL